MNRKIGQSHCNNISSSQLDVRTIMSLPNMYEGIGLFKIDMIQNSLKEFTIAIIQFIIDGHLAEQKKCEKMNRKSSKVIVTHCHEELRHEPKFC